MNFYYYFFFTYFSIRYIIMYINKKLTREELEMFLVQGREVEYYQFRSWRVLHTTLLQILDLSWPSKVYDILLPNDITNIM
jgi:hypothetical protein